MSKTGIRTKAARVKLLLLDVDGVLTDGRIIYDSRGNDARFFDVHDGMGVHLLRRAGIPVILVTAKGSRAILPRARDMQVAEIFADVSPKSAVLEKVLKKYGVEAEELCFVGDDLVDICLMKRVGFPVAVRNACAQVKRCAAYITEKDGGRGAVREVVELLLKSQKKWQEVVKRYEA